MRLHLGIPLRVVVVLCIGFAGLAASAVTLMIAHNANGGFGFPLDDAWIHLQFARNIHDYGAFSYYKNEMVTAGSTSPLYTILLALGFFVTSNEMALSYVIGIGALLFAAAMMYKLVLALYNGAFILAAGAALLLVLEPRLQWISLSGMETTLFIALFLAALWSYVTKRPRLFGILLGLLLWTRPDAAILFAAVAGTMLYDTYIVQQQTTRKRRTVSRWAENSWLKGSLPYAGVLVAAYAAFNGWLSGSILPNTYSAKLKYYAGSAEGFPTETFHFLTDGHLLVPAMLVLISVVGVLVGVLKRRRVPLLLPFLWSLGMFTAYWIDLPKLYQHGRYLMPLLPCFILMSVDGARRIVELASGWFSLLKKPQNAMAMSALIFVGIAIPFGVEVIENQKAYADDCRYISERQVKTALWIRDQLPLNAVVATHDIGAIAFYSRRRVVDMVGLVSPEMTKNIGRFDLLTQFLSKNNVTHVATLRNWFEIVNEQPLFHTDFTHPEIMEVFTFDPGRAHFASQEATRLNDAGEYYLSAGNSSIALQLIRRSLTLDPRSARTAYLAGLALGKMGDTISAGRMFRTVHELQPDYPGLAERLVQMHYPGK